MFKYIHTEHTKPPSRISRFILKLLSGTHNHYFCHLPQRIGLFATAVLKLFISRIRINAAQTEMLKNLQKKGAIVFANPHQSDFEFLFYYSRYKQLKLPYPEIGFYYSIFIWQPLSKLLRVFLSRVDFFFRYFSFPDPFRSGYIEHQLMEGNAGFVSLVDKRSFHRRFVKAKTDPFQFLLEIQKNNERPIFIVPQLMFYSIKPRRSAPSLTDMIFGSEENPGRLRRLFTLLNNPKKIFVEISDPVNLKNFLKRPDMEGLTLDQAGVQLRRCLLNQIDRHRQSIIGPVLKSRVEIKDAILTRDRVQQFIAAQAEKDNQPIPQIQRKAATYVEEIAANYSLNWIKVYDFALGIILKMLFDELVVDYKGLERVKKAAQKAPLVMVPCHKSHLDYLIISLLFYLNNMPCPHIAAGKNLSFWPFGTIFRGGGAFFMRRTFKGNPLYAKIFSEYIYRILQEGFNIEFFIEGGRSRTGKLLMPKLGLLSIILDAFRQGACEDIQFVPIFVGYDRIIEEKAYIHEIEGGQKEPESLKKVIQASKFLKKRYGKVYINFGEIISLKDYMEETGLLDKELTKKDNKTLCNQLGFRFINAINQVSVVTPYGIVAGTILNCAKKRIYYRTLKDHFESYYTHLLSIQAKLSDTLLIEPHNAFGYILNNFIQRKLIEPASKKTDDRFENTNPMFKINENRRPELDFYKNNIINFFVPAAFTASAILDQDAFLFSASDLHRSYFFLQELFINEFAYDVERKPEYFIRKTLKAFIDDAILIPHPTLPDTYNLTSVGLRKLKLFAAFLKSFLESYLIVASALLRYPEDALGESENLKKIISLGTRMYKRKEIECTEALSKIAYKNALKFFMSKKRKTSADRLPPEKYVEIIQRYLQLLQND